MSGIEALWWVPAVAVLAVTVLGLAAATGRPPGSARRFWVLGLAVGGIAAAAFAAWQATAAHTALGREAARLAETAGRLDQLGKLLPEAPGGAVSGNPTATFDTV